MGNWICTGAQNIVCCPTRLSSNIPRTEKYGIASCHVEYAICKIQSERSAVCLNAADKRVKPSFPLVYLSTAPSSSQSGIGMVMLISLFEAKYTRAGQICKYQQRNPKMTGSLVKLEPSPNIEDDGRGRVKILLKDSWPNLNLNIFCILKMFVVLRFCWSHTKELCQVGRPVMSHMVLQSFHSNNIPGPSWFQTRAAGLMATFLIPGTDRAQKHCHW